MNDASLTSLSARRSWLVLALLCALYVLSFLDRFILALLIKPLRADLGVSAVEMGLLVGSAFAIFYGLLSLPLARLSDRGDRRLVIIIGATLWSICTIASGFAQSFAMLVALRIGLAAGEAVLTPSAYSLIGDMFPPAQRATAATLYNAFGMLGASGSHIVGAAAIAAVLALTGDGSAWGFKLWQIVFLVVGIPTLAVAALFAAVAREPPRRGAGRASSLSDVFAFIRGHGWMYWGLFLGAGAVQLGASALIVWAPTFISDRYDLSIQGAGAVFGFTAMAGVVLGTLLFPALTTRVARAGAPDALIRVSATGAVLAGLLLTAAPLVASWPLFLILTGSGLFFGTGAANNVLTSVQTLVPSGMRATFTALALICLSTLALSIAPPLAAAIAGAFEGNSNALGIGISAVAGVGAALSALLLLKARKPVTAFVEGRAAEDRDEL